MKSLFPSAPTRYRNSCRCHYRGQWYHLGPWDTVNNQPSSKAIARYRSLEASIEAAPDLFKPPPVDFPMVKLLADFKEWSAGRGVRGYSLSLVKNTGLSLAAVFPDVLVRDFGPKRFKAWIASLKGLSSATRRKYARTALAALSWGIGEEMFEANECKLTELRECDPLEECTDAKAPKVVLPVEDTAIDAILPHLMPTLRTMVQVQRATGMRSGELCRMRPCDIHRSGVIVLSTGLRCDLDESTKRAREAGTIGKKESVWIYVPARHKTAHLGQPRDVPILPDVQRLIEPYLAGDPEKPLFSPKVSHAEFAALKRSKRKTKVQPSQIERAQRPSRLRHRDGYTPDSYARAITRACDEAGIERCHPHQIRHAVGTIVYAQTNNPTVVAALLGHTDLRTVQRYARRSVDAAIAGAAAARIAPQPKKPVRTKKPRHN